MTTRERFTIGVFRYSESLVANIRIALLAEASRLACQESQLEVPFDVTTEHIDAAYRRIVRGEVDIDA